MDDIYIDFLPFDRPGRSCAINTFYLAYVCSKNNTALGGLLLYFCTFELRKHFCHLLETPMAL